MQDPERRRGPRVRVTDSRALVIARRTQSAAYELVGFSVTGALLVGEFVLAPGEWLQMVLEITGEPPISVFGEVVRCDELEDQRHAIAVKFRNAAPDVEERLAHAVGRVRTVRARTEGD